MSGFARAIRSIVAGPSLVYTMVASEEPNDVGFSPRADGMIPTRVHFSGSVGSRQKYEDNAELIQAAARAKRAIINGAASDASGSVSPTTAGEPSTEPRTT